MTRKPIVTFAPLLAGLIFLLAGLSASRASQTTFNGEIADSQCATGVHSLNRSHKEMIAMGHAGKTSEDCARYCVHSRGGRYMLLTKDDIFKLDNQELAENYAGQKVRVTGTLDPETHIIRIKTIEKLDHSH